MWGARAVDAVFDHLVLTADVVWGQRLAHPPDTFTVQGADMRIHPLDVPQCIVGESPVWDEQEQALYFVDVYGRKVHRHDLSSGDNRSWDVPSNIGSMALRRSGGTVIALADGVHAMDLATGAVSMLAAPSSIDARIAFNDGKVDSRGRFLVSSFDVQMTDGLGALYSLDINHNLVPLADGIILGNGPCWSHDGKTLYFADTAKQTIYAYDYDLEMGKLSNRRDWVNTGELDGMPDGMTVDAEGLIWVVIHRGSKIAAFTPEGKVVRTVDVPVFMPSSIAFGGPNLDLLFVTSIDVTAAGLDAQPGAGGTYCIEGLGARGLPAARFAG